MVACVLLNQTTGTQVRKVLPELFHRYPDQHALSIADPEELSKLLKPCGLHNRRAKTLIKLSTECTREGWQSRVGELPGVGRYAMDSWNIFVLGHRPSSEEVTDKELKRFLKENGL